MILRVLVLPVGCTLLPAFAFGQADLSLTKTDSNDPVNAGTIITYTLTLANAGPSEAQNVIVSDDIPAGTTFFGAIQRSGPEFTVATPAFGAGGTFTASIGALAPGETAQFTLIVRTVVGSPPGTVVTNVANVTSTTNDPNTANNSDTETTSVRASIDLAITMTDSPDPVPAGGNVTYTLTVQNLGGAIAEEVKLSDILPDRTTFVSAVQTGGPSFTLLPPPAGGTTFTATAATFPSGATATIALIVKVDASTPGGATLVNAATVRTMAIAFDPNNSNNFATENTNISETADVSVSKMLDAAPHIAGQSVKFTITVSNVGPDLASDVSVVDTLPAGMTTLVATPSQGVCGATGPSVSCSLGTLPAGSSATVQVMVQTSSTAGTFTNTASVATSANDPSLANNASSIQFVTIAAGTIPALSYAMLALLALFLAAVAIRGMRS